MTPISESRTALVTGGSSGLGRALVHALTDRGWTVLTDARGATRLVDAVAGTGAHPLPGDLIDPDHRAELAAWVDDRAGLDLLVLNASTLGPLPMHPLAQLSPPSLAAIFETNALAPLELAVSLLPALRSRAGVVVTLSSDAAVGHYPTWGGYGASKAALDHLVLTLGAETGVATYALDPGDMRTPMHQDAFPGEDITDRPWPETVVPHLLALVHARPAPGRYLAADIAVPAEATR
ncbi:SDR family NAD(P)-dependent oxidoreductase [Nocardioides sp. LHG3406-4]|uniref:SDR family NAD(P)-dependent oxidoreductase n=1 Tax=Nocardioides sp. LHG3406-4 TaxID=2804575 RepID=UPI003CF59241